MDWAGLGRLKELTTGRPEIAVGLIDGPVAVDHPLLARATFRDIGGNGGCLRNDSASCVHGTLVAGVLAARRGTAVPAICPDCTFIVRPVFREMPAGSEALPVASPDELAAAIFDTIEAGARIINLSLGLLYATPRENTELRRALDHAMRRGVICVVAAGNQGWVGGSALTSHPWVIPVVACDRTGHPIGSSNLGAAIGRNGLRAPGVDIASLDSKGRIVAFGGTSAATPFVTGTAALLWSLFPRARASDLRLAITGSRFAGRSTVVPPMLDAWDAHQRLAANMNRKVAS